MPNKQQLQWLSTAAPQAVEVEKSAGCPAELLIAQAIEESGWGMHEPGLNLFGIKSFPGCHGTQLLATREWFSPSQAAAFTATNAARTAVMHEPQERDTIGRYLYDCQDEFATFPTLAACFAKRAELFSAGPYAPFAAAYRDTGDLTAYIDGIGPIYATAPNYAAMLREIINEPSVRAALTAARATASISA